MFHGQPMFAVVAETRDAARRAATLAKIEIERETPDCHGRGGAGVRRHACCPTTRSAAATPTR